MQDKPQLYSGLNVYWNAFFELSGKRTYSSLGPNPLQTSEILSWLDLHGITELDDRSTFFRLIGALDSVWLTHNHDEAEQERKERERKVKEKNANTSISNRRKKS